MYYPRQHAPRAVNLRTAGPTDGVGIHTELHLTFGRRTVKRTPQNRAVRARCSIIRRICRHATGAHIISNDPRHLCMVEEADTSAVFHPRRST